MEKVKEGDLTVIGTASKSVDGEFVMEVCLELFDSLVVWVRLYTFLVFLETDRNIFFHKLWTSGLRAPWKQKSKTPWKATMNVKIPWNMITIAVTSWLVARNPNPHPRPNVIDSTTAIIRFLVLKRFSSLLVPSSDDVFLDTEFKCLQIEAMMMINMIQLNK